MQFKIGGRDPRFRGIGGRNMSEISRLFQLFVSLQILFGSRRGGVPFLLPLLFVGALAAGGWFLFQKFSSPERMLEQAHAEWDSGVTERKLDAMVKYKELLQKTNPLEPGTKWLTTDRDMLYRRIIEYEYKFEKNESTTWDWIVRAWDEGIRDLRLPQGEVLDFWKETTDQLRLRNRSRNSRGGERRDAKDQGQQEQKKESQLENDPRLNGLLDELIPGAN